MTNRKLRYSGLGLAALTVGAIAACSSDGGTPAGGGAAPGTGGTSSGGGSSNTGGTPAAAGTPGTAGTSATAGSAGTSATGGSGGAGAGFACTGAKLTNPLITGFTNPTASGANFTLMDGIPGGTFSYQAAALTLTVSADNALNVKGNVKAYDGFGMYFNSCQDASGFTGVSFKIKGYVGPKGKLNFRVQTNATTAIDTTNSKGSCVVPPGTTDTYPLCHASAFDIPVTAAGATVSVNFSQLAGGVPVAAVTGSDVVGLEWAFDWTPAPAGAAGSGAGGASTGTGGASGSGAGGSAGKGGSSAGGSSAGGATGGSMGGPYDADVTIDDIVFIGGAPVGGAGGASAGGASAGGASAGGSGGASTGSGGASAGSGGKAGGN